MNSSAHIHDVIIIGAGPAGCAAALRLAGSGADVLLLEKSTFPRDKICGDAIGSRVKKVLRRIDPSLADELEKFENKNIAAGWKLYSPKGKSVSLKFVHKGYVSRRTDFDNFLAAKVKDAKGIQFIENVSVVKFENHPGRAVVTDETGNSFSGKLVIGCDGAHSSVVRNKKPYSKSSRHYSAAVRSYYKGIAGMEPHTLEIHLVEGFLPGYFWIFPLDDDTANVGFGMLSDDIRRRRLDLRSSLLKIIDSEPLRRRFKNAVMQDEAKGFGLPLGGITRKISGERFMLCGDAASLIDPLNGEGIGNAMLSGVLAAEHALQALSRNIFTQAYLSAYDREIEKVLLPELKKKLFMQRLFNRGWLIEALVGVGASSRFLREWIGRRL